MTSSFARPAPGLRLLCHAVRALAVIGVPLALQTPLWVLRASGAEQEVLWRQVSGLAPDTLLSTPPLTLFFAAAILALPAVVALYGLWQLWQLFGAFAAGEALTAHAQRYLRRFAWALLASTLLRPLTMAGLSVVLTIGNPEGQRVFLVGIGSDQYPAILLGAVLLVIAIVMSEAVHAAEENRGFV